MTLPGGTGDASALGVAINIPKPDWAKWGSFVEATWLEAVALTCDIAPEHAADASSMPTEYYRRRDIAANQGGAKRFEVFSRGKRIGLVDLDEFGKWAIGVGWSLPDEFPIEQDGADEGSDSVGPWPWGAYETPLLKELAEAVRHFWTDYKPEAAPTRSQVVDWLEKRGCTERAAKAIAQIVRPPDLPDGPRVKRDKRNG